jgi:hypothetical protein
MADHESESVMANESGTEFGDTNHVINITSGGVSSPDNTNTIIFNGTRGTSINLNSYFQPRAPQSSTPRSNLNIVTASIGNPHPGDPAVPAAVPVVSAPTLTARNKRKHDQLDRSNPVIIAQTSEEYSKRKDEQVKVIEKGLHANQMRNRKKNTSSQKVQGKVNSDVKVKTRNISQTELLRPVTKNKFLELLAVNIPIESEKLEYVWEPLKLDSSKGSIYCKVCLVNVRTDNLRATLLKDPHKPNPAFHHKYAAHINGRVNYYKTGTLQSNLKVHIHDAVNEAQLSQVLTQETHLFRTNVYRACLIDKIPIYSLDKSNLIRMLEESTKLKVGHSSDLTRVYFPVVRKEESIKLEAEFSNRDDRYALIFDGKKKVYLTLILFLNIRY